jgi:C4-dicarboxylate-specific signal transduction histidine kinase
MSSDVFHLSEQQKLVGSFETQLSGIEDQIKRTEKEVEIDVQKVIFMTSKPTWNNAGTVGFRKNSARFLKLIF